MAENVSDEDRALNMVKQRHSHGSKMMQLLSSAFFCSVLSAAKLWYIFESCAECLV